MFHIKICGVRQPQDVQAVADSGADAIGLNFYQRSVRYVDPDRPSTVELSGLASERKLLKVGVFVNAAPESIARIVDAIDLDVIQLHGDEELSSVAAIRSATKRPIVRAIKLPTTPLSVQQIEAKARDWIEAGCHPLFDADAGAAHGGSGKALHWPSLGAWSTRSPGLEWTLAGGLNPENVDEAIRQTAAQSVDTASGVEEPKGVKSAALIERFVAQARGQWGVRSGE